MNRITLTLVACTVLLESSAQLIKPATRESIDAMSSRSQQTLEGLMLNKTNTDVRVAVFGDLLKAHVDNELDIIVPGLKSFRVRAKTDRFEYASESHFSYVGSTDDGYVILGKKGDQIYGQINTKGRIVGISQLEGDKVVLYDYDLDKLTGTSCGDFLRRRGKKSVEEGHNIDVARRIDKEDVKAPIEHLADPVVRVLVLYTPAANATNYSIPNLVNTIMDQYSAARSYSQISTQLYLAGIVQLNTVEDTSGEDATTRIENTTIQLGANPAAQALRDSYEADLVVMLTNGDFGEFTGNSLSFGPSNANAYAVAQIYAAAANYTFIHELGHLFGCHHDNDNTGPYSDSKAHEWRTGLWPFHTDFTSIVYHRFDPQNYVRTLHYSNPDVYNHGKRTGVYGEETMQEL